MSGSLPLLAVAWLASAACAHAPRDEDRADLGIDQARVLLASRVPSEIAWGAFRAGEAGWSELAPDVVLALAQAIDLPASKEQVWVVRSVLDAAIRVDARPRPVDLAWVRERMASLSGEVSILAAREPLENLALLERLGAGRPDELWIAAVNLLAAHAPDRIAPNLIGDARIAISVEVVDEGSALAFGGRHSSAIGCGGLEAPAGFPPSAIYTLRRRTKPSTDVFAAGPIAIGFEREVHVESTFGVGGRFEPVDRGDYGLRLLRWITGDRGEPGLLASEVSIRHAWRDEAEYLDEVGAHVRAQRDAWRSIMTALHERGAIDEHVAATPAPIEITIDDRRADKSIAIPPLPR